jgi:hypothetical protein
MVLEFDVPLEVAQAAREQAKELSFSDAAKVGSSCQPAVANCFLL